MSGKYFRRSARYGKTEVQTLVFVDGVLPRIASFIF